MQKSEMMKRYEAETWSDSIGDPWDHDESPIHTDSYVTWLESKAKAYDRLMSGEPTAKEIANILNRIIAMDADFKWYAFGAIPYGTTKFRWVAVRGSTKYRVPCFKLTFDGDWKDSLTFTDGWEEK